MSIGPSCFGSEIEEGNLLSVHTPEYFAIQWCTSRVSPEKCEWMNPHSLFLSFHHFFFISPSFLFRCLFFAPSFFLPRLSFIPSGEGGYVPSKSSLRIHLGSQHPSSRHYEKKQPAVCFFSSLKNLLFPHRTVVTMVVSYDRIRTVFLCSL